MSDEVRPQTPTPTRYERELAERADRLAAEAERELRLENPEAGETVDLLRPVFEAVHDEEQRLGRRMTHEERAEAAREIVSLLDAENDLGEAS